jgi:hypothetical protein
VWLVPAATFRALLLVRLGLSETDHRIAFLVLPAFAEEFHALEPFQDISFRRDGAGAFETAMLGHWVILVW